jgi:hemerythrin-like domain-containing protein
MRVATDAVERRLILGEKVSPDTRNGHLEFLRLFADRCHHGKKKDFLFPQLETSEQEATFVHEVFVL